MTENHNIGWKDVRILAVNEEVFALSKRYTLRSVQSRIAIYVYTVYVYGCHSTYVTFIL